MKLPATPLSTWSERYETLRRYILEDRRILPAETLGLRLWMNCGMSAWMNHWTELTAGAAQPPAAGPPPRCPTTSAWQQQLTLLLAQITVHHLQPNPSL